MNMNTSQDTPKWLYHGTSKRNLGKIIREGLKPRAVTGQSNWKHVVESHSSMVYLTAGYATYFGFDTLREQKNNKFGMVRIDLRALDETKLYPDEDYLAHTIGLVPAECNTLEQKIEWARNNLHQFQHLWRESINALGNCCYEGTIPTAAIDKAVIVDVNNGCGKEFVALLFENAVCGRVNVDYYAKRRNQLELLNQYLFKEPFDIDAWVREFCPGSFSLPESLFVEFKRDLNTRLIKYSGSIKELMIPKNCVIIQPPIKKSVDG
jgi:hypothetical protein